MRKFLLEGPVEEFLSSKREKRESNGFPELLVVEAALQTISDSAAELIARVSAEGKTKASILCGARSKANAADDKKIRRGIIMAKDLGYMKNENEYRISDRT